MKKRTATLALALMLVLAACGTAALSATPSPTPAETTLSESQQAASGGLSPETGVLLGSLEALRANGEGLDDERIIRDTLTYFFLLYNSLAARKHEGFDAPDFAAFFDADSPNYGNALYYVDYARYLSLLAELSDTPGYSWYNTLLEFESLKIDGDTAEAQVHNLLYMIYEGNDMLSAQGDTPVIELKRVDGVWLISDIETAISFVNAHTHEYTLDRIAELETELAQKEASQ